MITALRKPHLNREDLERQSAEMADIAKTYDEELQDQDIPMDPRMHIQIIKKVLRNLDKKVPPKQLEELEGPISKEEIRKAIQALQRGKVAGLDRIDNT